MYEIKNPTLGLMTALSFFLINPAITSADTLKLRMSVESTPGASTQHMLASFRDALNIEMGDDVAIEYFDSGTLGDEIVHTTGPYWAVGYYSDWVRCCPIG